MTEDEFKYLCDLLDKASAVQLSFIETVAKMKREDKK